MTCSMRNLSIVRLLILVAMLLVATVTAVEVQAQTQAWVKIEIVQVRLDAISDYIAVQKDRAALEKNAGTPWYTVWQTSGLGQTGKFIITSPVANFADFGTSPYAGPERDALIARGTKCVVSRQVMAVAPLAGVRPQPLGQVPKMSVVQLVEVAPGREDDYEAWLHSEYFANFPDDIRFAAGRIGLGGRGFVQAVFFDSYDEIAKGAPHRRNVSPERAREIDTKRAGIVTGGESMVLRTVPEASYDTRTP